MGRHSNFIAVTNNRRKDAEENDFYATDPMCLQLLLENENFKHDIWECACGAGHLSSGLEKKGFNVKSSDIIDRGFHNTLIENFLLATTESFDKPYDIITNPPFKCAKEFVEHAIDVAPDKTKIAMFLKLTFLEGKSRRELFDKYPPKTVYVFSNRVECGKNGIFTGGSAVAYCWYIWEKNFTGTTELKWIN